MFAFGHANQTVRAAPIAHSELTRYRAPTSRVAPAKCTDMAAAGTVTDLDPEPPFRVAAAPTSPSHSDDASPSAPPPPPASVATGASSAPLVPPAAPVAAPPHQAPSSPDARPSASPQAAAPSPPAASPPVPASALVGTPTHAVRIAARVPPPEPRSSLAAPASAPAVANGGSPASPAVHAAVAAREASLRVRSALTKGWRKGKKPRKSVGGGRGPGFTQREVDGLLELLEVHVPVTRDEWERVRNQHAVRFPGTSRSVDSIRRKFAKSYLSRSAASDPNAPPSVRRAKLIRERMAARAISIDDGGGAGEPMAALRVDVDLDVDGAPPDHDADMDVEGDHDADSDDEGEAHPRGVSQASELAAGPSLDSATPLDEASLPMLPPVADAGTGVAMGGRPTVSPRGASRKKAGDKGEGGAGDDFASLFKMFMLQEASRREEERRIRAEERAEQRAMEKARQEREDHRTDQFMQLMMLLASNKAREN